MKCQACGGSRAVRDTRDLTHTYKGQSTTVPAVVADYCPDCGEAVMDARETDRVMAEMGAFNRSVNASLVDPQFILGVRKKLRLDQQAAAAIFGGGANAFSRYETGKTRPPRALVHLLRLLDQHPELMREISPGTPAINHMNAPDSPDPPSATPVTPATPVTQARSAKKPTVRSTAMSVSSPRAVARPASKRAAHRQSLR